MSTPDTTSETPAPGRTEEYRASANAIWYDDMVLARLSGFADTDEVAAELVHRANCYPALVEALRRYHLATCAVIKASNSGCLEAIEIATQALRVVARTSEEALATATKGAL